MLILVPEIGDGSTLQHRDEEKDYARDDGKQHDDADNPGVYALNGDP